MPVAAQNPEERPPFPWRWFAATLGIVFLRALPNLRFPIGRDQATCCVIAQRMLEGLHLYRDLLDNRPPGIFFLYAPFVKLLGPVMWVAGMADILVVLVVSGLLLRFAHRHLGTPVTVIGTVAAASFHCSAGYINAAQPDGLLLVFIFAACALLALDRSAIGLHTFAAGAMLAAAFWVKYNAVAFFPWVAIVAYLDWSALDGARPRLAFRVAARDLWVRVFMLAAGFAALSALVLASFALSGSWAAFRESQLDVLLRYGATSFGQHAHGTWAVSELYLYVGPWNYAAVALALFVAWRERELGRVLPVVLAFLSGMAAILLPGKLHSYYVEMLFPFYGLCWGYIAVKGFRVFQFAQAYLARRSFHLARALSWVVLVNLAFGLVFSEGLRVVADFQYFSAWARNPRASYPDYFPQHSLDKFADQLKVIDFLRTHSAAGDQAFVWGTAPLINFLSERHSPVRFVSNLGLVSPWGPEHWRTDLVRDLDARAPLFIVVARRDAIPSVSQSYLDSEQMLASYPALAGLISSRYEPAARLRNFDIYRRK